MQAVDVLHFTGRIVLDRGHRRRGVDDFKDHIQRQVVVEFGVEDEFEAADALALILQITPLLLIHVVKQGDVLAAAQELF